MSQCTPTPVYLDCNATTPLEPAVRELMLEYFDVEYGNAGSRTHVFGASARRAVEEARDRISAVLAAPAEDIIFTSGATESNNIALLGLAAYGIEDSRRHIVSTQIEHKAVLEPLEELERRGFEVTLLKPNPGGWVDPDSLAEALRPDTLLVSTMHVNNETGVEQPLGMYCDVLRHHEAYFHVDAAQGFGKRIAPLQESRIDLVSVSSHKIFGPKGVGALVTRRRRFRRPPLMPLNFGGGQERGLRPGTLPVPLIVGFGEAARLALRDHAAREAACLSLRERILDAIKTLPVRIHGDLERSLPHTLNIAIPGLNSEAAIVALKGLAAISNGSSCTSASYEPSHVLVAMGLSELDAEEALRLSWCHQTGNIDLDLLVATLKVLI